MDYQRKFKLAVSPKQAYEAWISESMTIEPVVKIEIDAKPGGQFILHAQSGDDTHLMEGTILEIIPEKMLRYSWQWQGDPESTTVTVTFDAEGKGCLLEINHQGFLSQESLERHQSGWGYYVAELERLIRNKL